MYLKHAMIKLNSLLNKKEISSILEKDGVGLEHFQYIAENITENKMLPLELQAKDFKSTFDGYIKANIAINANRHELVKFLYDFGGSPDETLFIVDFVVENYFNNNFNELTAAALTMMLHILKYVNKGDIIIIFNGKKLFWKEGMTLEEYIRRM